MTNEKQEQRKTDMIEGERRGLIAQVLASHIGAPNAIGMGELYVLVYGETWENRINDTRKLRKDITIMRREGVPINSSSSSRGGGYYYAAAGSELANFLKRDDDRAKKILKRNAGIKKVSLPNYLGQKMLEWGGGDDEAA